MTNNRRDGSKLSFSERDKLMRERKQGRGGGGGGAKRGGGGGASVAQKSYRAALERAFDSGQLAEFAATMQRGNDRLEAAFRDAGKQAADADSAPQANPSDATAAHAAGASDASDASAASADASTAARLGAHDRERAERRNLVKAILQAESPREVARAIDKFLARFDSLPADYEVLEKALIHAKPRVVQHALEQLASCIERKKPRRSRSLCVQLAILEDSHSDDEIRTLAARIRGALE